MRSASKPEYEPMTCVNKSSTENDVLLLFRVSETLAGFSLYYISLYYISFYIYIYDWYLLYFLCSIIPPKSPNKSICISLFVRDLKGVRPLWGLIDPKYN